MCHGQCATGILPVLGHGQDGHGTSKRATGILPVLGHGQDGHGTANNIQLGSV
jgi:hypothetical protein